MSAAPTPQRIGIDDLPAELIAQIATNTGDATLISLAAASRGLRTKAFHVYGNHFFRILKFCLYPNSLQALTDISYTPHLAKFVQYVVFGTEDVGLIDPAHDGEFRRGVARHTPGTMYIIDESEKLDTRMRVDSGCIAQALTKFPVLRQIFLGDRVMIDGKETRWSWGATRLDQFECPSGHCSIKVGSRTITIGYRTVILALAQIGGQLEHTKLGVSLNRADCTKPQPEAYTIVWNDAAYLSSRITTLQLQLLAAQQNFNHGPVQDIVNNASIDSL
jgi:hypothetical protein